MTSKQKNEFSSEERRLILSYLHGKFHNAKATSLTLLAGSTRYETRDKAVELSSTPNGSAQRVLRHRLRNVSNIQSSAAVKSLAAFCSALEGHGFLVTSELSKRKVDRQTAGQSAELDDLTLYISRKQFGWSAGSQEQAEGRVDRESSATFGVTGKARFTPQEAMTSPPEVKALPNDESVVVPSPVEHPALQEAIPNMSVVLVATTPLGPDVRVLIIGQSEPMIVQDTLQTIEYSGVLLRETKLKKLGTPIKFEAHQIRQVLMTAQHAMTEIADVLDTTY